MRRSGDQHRVYRDQHATAKRSIRERWTDTGQDHPMPYEGRRLPPVHVGRADVHGHILNQQVPPFHSGRGHSILQNAQFGAGSHGLARHRSQRIRPPWDLHQEAGRQGLRGKTVRIQPQQQGVPHLQSGQRYGRGEPERHLPGNAGIHSTSGCHDGRLPLRGRRSSVHVGVRLICPGVGPIHPELRPLISGARRTSPTPTTRGAQTQQD